MKPEKNEMIKYKKVFLGGVFLGAKSTDAFLHEGEGGGGVNRNKVKINRQIYFNSKYKKLNFGPV
jgi:hypothetical protein